MVRRSKQRLAWAVLALVLLDAVLAGQDGPTEPPGGKGGLSWALQLHGEPGLPSAAPIFQIGSLLPPDPPKTASAQQGTPIKAEVHAPPHQGKPLDLDTPAAMPEPAAAAATLVDEVSPEQSWQNHDPTGRDHSAPRRALMTDAPRASRQGATSAVLRPGPAAELKAVEDKVDAHVRCLGAAAGHGNASSVGRRLLQGGTGDVTSAYLIKRGNSVIGYDVKITTNPSLAGGDMVVLNGNLDITVQAYRIRIATGGLTALGKVVTLIAKEIVCDDPRADSDWNACQISVSGTDAAAPNPAKLPKSNDGVSDSLADLHGKPGAHSTYTPGNGGNGGRIKVLAGELDARLNFQFRGGDGSYGQIGGDGGNGGQPPRPLAPYCQNGPVGYDWGCVKHWEWYHCAGTCNQYEWSGAKGYTSGNGGNAGKNSANGNGGNGGALLVRTAKLNRGSTLRTTRRRGQGGRQATRASPGRAGYQGPGGCPARKTYEDWGLCFDSWCHWCGAESNFIKAKYGPYGDSGQPGASQTLPAYGNDGNDVTYDAVTAAPIKTGWGVHTELTPDLLRMLLRKARDFYVSGDLSSVEGLGRFIIDSRYGCTAGGVRTACDKVAEQATAMLYRLSQGQSFAGAAANWVSTLSISVIQDLLDTTLLPSLEKVEGAYKTLIDTAKTKQQKLDALRAMLAEIKSRANSLKDEQTLLQHQISTNLDTLNTQLKDQRGSYGAELTKHAAAFERAIQQKQADDRMFLIMNTVLDCMAFTAFTAGGAANIYKNADASSLGYAMQSLKDISAGVRELTDPNLQPVMPKIITTLKSTTPAGAALAWTEAKAVLGNDPEQAKLLVEQEKLDALLEEYMNLPAGGEYQKAMAAYVAAVQNYNDMIMKINDDWATFIQLQKDEDALRAQVLQVETQIVNANDDPTLPAAINFAAESYQELQDLSVYYLLLEQGAYNYVSLKQLSLTVTQLDAVSLIAKQATLKSSILADVQSNLGPAQTTNFAPIYINRGTLSNFDNMVAAQKMNFVFAPCHPAFISKSHVRVKEVSIEAIGAKGLAAPPQVSEVCFYLSHPGRTELTDEAGLMHSYTHLERLTFHCYDINTGTVITQGRFDYDITNKNAADPLSGIYISVSPMTLWELTFPTKVNQNVDLSNVTDIIITFKGSAKPRTNTDTCPLLCKGYRLPPIIGGSWQASCATTSPGDTCYGTCTTPNYIPDPTPPTATCDDSNFWALGNGLCTRVCLGSDLPAVKGTWSANCSSTSTKRAGEVCSATCAAGRRAVPANPVATCMANGIWALGQGKCVAECKGSSLPKIIGATWTPQCVSGTALAGDVCKSACDFGMVGVPTAPTATCTDGNTWRTQGACISEVQQPLICSVKIKPTKEGSGVAHLHLAEARVFGRDGTRLPSASLTATLSSTYAAANNVLKCFDKQDSSWCGTKDRDSRRPSLTVRLKNCKAYGGGIGRVEVVPRLGLCGKVACRSYINPFSMLFIHGDNTFAQPNYVFAGAKPLYNVPAPVKKPTCSVKIQLSKAGATTTQLHLAEVRVFGRDGKQLPPASLTATLSSTYAAANTVSKCFDNRQSTWCATKVSTTPSLTIAMKNCKAYGGGIGRVEVVPRLGQCGKVACNSIMAQFSMLFRTAQLIAAGPNYKFNTPRASYIIPTPL